MFILLLSKGASGVEGSSLHLWDIWVDIQRLVSGSLWVWLAANAADLGTCKCRLRGIAPKRYSSPEINTFLSVFDLQVQWRGLFISFQHRNLKQVWWTVSFKCLFLFSDSKGSWEDHLTHTIWSISKVKRGWVRCQITVLSLHGRLFILYLEEVPQKLGDFLAQTLSTKQKYEIKSSHSCRSPSTP